MPGRKKRTNFFLLLAMAALCFCCGYFFQQSTENPARIQEGRMELFAAKDTDDPDKEQPVDLKEEPEITKPPAAQVSPTAVPVVFEVSPEAGTGIWTSSGSNWMFLVNGTPHTGWLTDTDGKRYFFNKDGIMQTGWVDDGGKRYFMDLDGIMQTGFITTEGKSYELLEDGSLKGYSEETSKKEKAKEKKQTQTPALSKAADKEASKTEPEKKKTKYVALTFDDGPSSFTDRLLDCLEKNKAKATFFMVGKEIEYFSEEVKRMQKLGCELGNHTYSHADLTSLSPEEMTAEIAGVDNLLAELTGRGASVVRPPYGSVNDSVKSTVGTPMILWSIDTLDWESQEPDKIVETTVSQVEDGSVILMHDIFSTSVDAAEILIPRLKKEGYEFVTVHELAKKNGIELSTGTTYRDLKKQT